MTAMEKNIIPVARKRLHEDIVHQLQKKIILNEIKAGEKLPAERNLAELFEVNRATIREALKKLELLSLVEIRHGDGVYAKNYLESGNLELLNTIVYLNDEVNVDVIKDLLVIRRIITPEMAGLAALNVTSDQLLTIDSLIKNEKDVQKKDIEIHEIISKASKNLFFIFILNFFHKFIYKYGFLYFSDKKNVERSEKFHIDIYNALKNKDSQKSEKIMREVLVYTEKQILNTF